MANRRAYPRGVPYSIKYPEIPLYAFLENSARKFPNRDAMIFYGNRLTYDRIWDETRRLATALQRVARATVSDSFYRTSLSSLSPTTRSFWLGAWSSR